MQEDNTHPVGLPALANLRRRVLPLASTAAALGLAGCSLSPLAFWQRSQPAPAAPESAASQKTAAQVQAFTAGVESALDRADPDTAVRPVHRKPPDGVAAAPEPPPPAPAAQGDRSSVTGFSTVGAASSVRWDAAPLGVPEFTPVALQPADGPLSTPQALLGQPPVAPPVVAVTAAPFEFTRSPGSLVLASAGAGAGQAPSPESAALPPPPSAAPPSLDSAMDIVREHVAAHPTLNSALALALLDQSQDRPLDPAAVKNLSAADQKLYEELFAALEATAAAPDSSMALRAAPLVQAAMKWQADADLKLPVLALASRVDSYGVFQRLEPKFPAGKKQTVIIYCEVANFVPKKTDDGWYETRLAQQETLATDDGLLLFRPNAEEVLDRSKNQRRDFYLVKKLTIPDNLAVGKYALRMSVTDLNTNKIAVVSLPIEITK